MQISRLVDAPQFQANNHWDMRSLRIQEGGSHSGPGNCNISLSYFLPGGGAGPDSSPTEKIYVVLDGQMSIQCGDFSGTMTVMDSCVVPPNSERTFVNSGVTVARVLVVTMIAGKANP